MNALTSEGARAEPKRAFSEPGRLRPDRTRKALTEQAAARFATPAHQLRVAGHEPQFLSRILFCVLAEAIGMLPDKPFSRMVHRLRKHPAQFRDFACERFGAMAHGGCVDFEGVAWFTGGLFSDGEALAMDGEQLGILSETAHLEMTGPDRRCSRAWKRWNGTSRHRGWQGIGCSRGSTHGHTRIAN